MSDDGVIFAYCMISWLLDGFCLCCGEVHVRSVGAESRCSLGACYRCYCLFVPQRSFYSPTPQIHVVGPRVTDGDGIPRPLGLRTERAEAIVSKTPKACTIRR